MCTGHQLPEKTKNFEFLGLNLPQKRLWCRDFKNVSLDLESASLRLLGAEISRQKGQFFNFWSQICLKIDFGVGI